MDALERLARKIINILDSGRDNFELDLKSGKVLRITREWDEAMEFCYVYIDLCRVGKPNRLNKRNLVEQGTICHTMGIDGIDELVIDLASLFEKVRGME